MNMDIFDWRELKTFKKIFFKYTGFLVIYLLFIGKLILLWF